MLTDDTKGGITMKKMLFLLTALLMLCTGAALAYDYTAFGAENTPESIRDFITQSRWSDWEITGWTNTDTNVRNAVEGFVAVKKGSSNTLLAFTHDKDWKYAWYNSSALPQVEEPIILGRSGDGGEVGKLVSCYVVDGEVEEAHCTWVQNSSGRWMLEQILLYYTPNLMFIDAKDGMLHMYNTGWTEKDIEANIYGEYQRDLRYFDFNAFPKTIADAREKLSNPPKIPGGTLSAEKIKFSSGKKYEVYQGPGEEYKRAANGKANVSTNDWIQVFGEENGYIMIQYDISSDRYRIGWITADALPFGTEVDEISYQPIQGYLTVAATLTDDPLNSETTVTSLAQGTPVQWLATMGDWAYVETTSGDLQRGFVPWQAVKVASYTSSAVRSDVMESMSGYWAYTAGGSMFYDSVMLYKDGSFAAWLGYQAMEDTYELIRGQWSVTDYNAASNLYWNDPPYEITFTDSNGKQTIKGLTYAEDSFSLTNDEGSGGYERREPPVDDPNIESDEYQNG